jgi:hypothetical protein
MVDNWKKSGGFSGRISLSMEEILPCCHSGLGPFAGGDNYSFPEAVGNVPGCKNPGTGGRTIRIDDHFAFGIDCRQMGYDFNLGVVTKNSFFFLFYFFNLAHQMVDVMGVDQLVTEFFHQVGAGNKIKPHIIMDLRAVNGLASEVPGDQESFHSHGGSINRSG